MYYGEDQKKEIKEHLKGYINRKDKEVVQDLVPCCQNCQNFGGTEHDFSECHDCPILELWYEVNYWRWYGSYCD